MNPKKDNDIKNTFKPELANFNLVTRQPEKKTSTSLAVETGT
jgi:hypothetical protein